MSRIRDCLSGKKQDNEKQKILTVHPYSHCFSNRILVILIFLIKSFYLYKIPNQIFSAPNLVKSNQRDCWRMPEGNTSKILHMPTLVVTIKNSIHFVLLIFLLMFFSLPPIHYPRCVSMCAIFNSGHTSASWKLDLIEFGVRGTSLIVCAVVKELDQKKMKVQELN